MNVCFKCLKAIESREGPQCFFAHHNFDERACDVCGNIEEGILFELLIPEKLDKSVVNSDEN